MYSSTLILTSALDGVGGQRHASAALPPGKDPVPIVQEAELASKPFWTGAENLAPTGIRFPYRPVSSKSLYRLSYPGFYFVTTENLNYNPVQAISKSPHRTLFWKKSFLSIFQRL